MLALISCRSSSSSSIILLMILLYLLFLALAAALVAAPALAYALALLFALLACSSASPSGRHERHHDGPSLRLLLGFRRWLRSLAPPSRRRSTRGAVSSTSTQEADGGWTSGRVRRTQAVSEALLALAALAASPAAADGRGGSLGGDPAVGQRRPGSAPRGARGEGRDVAALSSELIAAADPAGGFGLRGDPPPDVLDTGLALESWGRSRRAGCRDARCVSSRCLPRSGDDGGWACVRGRAERCLVHEPCAPRVAPLSRRVPPRDADRGRARFPWLPAESPMAVRAARSRMDRGDRRGNARPGGRAGHRRRALGHHRSISSRSSRRTAAGAAIPTMTRTRCCARSTRSARCPSAATKR